MRVESIGNSTIQISGTDFSSKEAEIRKQIQTLQQQLNKLKKAAELDPGNKKIGEMQVGAISAQATNAARKVALLNQGIKDLEVIKVLDDKGEFNESSKSIRELVDETDDLALAAKDADRAYADVNGRMQKLYKEIKDANPKTKLADIRAITNEGKFNEGVLETLVKEKKITQEQADKLISLINSTTRVMNSNDSLVQIVTEEAQAFFAGQRSAEDVAKLVQSKANIYVNEQR